MDKKYLPNIPGADGRPQGPLMQMLDFLQIQFFLEKALADFLKAVLVKASASPQVDGFGATIGDGLNLSIATGLALDLQGLLYNTDDAATEIELVAADPAQPRIDLIIAALEVNVPAAVETRDYKTLLTYAERQAGVRPLETPYETHTQLKMRATVTVKTGVAAAVPEVPALAAGEVPLWRVRVNAGVVAIQEDKLTDVRNMMPHLGQIASSTILGLIKIGAGFTIDPDGTLNNVFSDLEVLQDALSTSFHADAPFSINYNDPLNRWDFNVATATAALRGLISAADQARLNNATPSNVASTLVQRSASGDLNGRDITAERQIVYADSSIQNSAARNEEFIPIIRSHTAIVVGTGTANETVTIANDGGQPYEIWVNVEDYLNIPLCLSAVFIVTAPNLGVVELQLYNATDGVVLVTLSQSTAVNNTVREARSLAFNLTGSGRKRLNLRYHEGSNPHTAGLTCTIWRARLVRRPGFTNCGNSTGVACPI